MCLQLNLVWGFLYFCEFSMCLPSNYNDRLKFEISSVNQPIVPGNRDEITDISDIFTPDYWFPIEINVPDTFMTAWESIESAWAYALDYFSMSSGEMSSTQGINQNSLYV